MPFTIAHTAAVLPFSRPLARWRVLSAAVIGSMVPDFGWFWPWRPARFETHGVLSLVTFCLPLGLATYWLFQRVLKEPMVELLPPGAYSRWLPFAEPADYRSVHQWLGAALAVLVGALTHLVWDAFTHEGARGVRMIPALDEPTFSLGVHHVAGARLLQDASSLIGLALISAIVAYGLRRSDAAAPVLARRLTARQRHVWVGLYGLVTLMFSVAFGLVSFFSSTRSRYAVPHGWLMPVSVAAISLLRGLAAALLCVTLGLRWRLRRASVT